MNKILHAKIPPGVFVLLALGIFFGSILLLVEKMPLKWLSLFGLIVFFGAKIGQAFKPEKKKIGEILYICSKVGILTVIGGIILKAFVIIKQQYVGVAGIPVEGADAIVQGIFLIIFALVLSFYALKYIK